MRSFLILLVAAWLPFAACCQTKPTAPARTKILLLGVMHFTPSTTDVYKNQAVDLTSAQRQPQVQTVVEKLAAFHPNQICVEWTTPRQATLDSLYQAYLSGKYKLQSDEIDQFGFRTAQRLKLPHLTAVNWRDGEFDMDKVTAAAKQYHQEDVMAALDAYSKSFMAESDALMQNSTVRDFLLYLNAPRQLDANSGFYSGYLARIGAGADYAGIKLIRDWYDTNFHIYANMLRRIQPADKAVLVVFGQGHIPILKSLFAANPAFEVVEVSSVLK